MRIKNLKSGDLFEVDHSFNGHILATTGEWMPEQVCTKDVGFSVPKNMLGKALFTVTEFRDEDGDLEFDEKLVATTFKPEIKSDGPYYAAVDGSEATNLYIAIKKGKKIKGHRPIEMELDWYGKKIKVFVTPY